MAPSLVIFGEDMSTIKKSGSFRAAERLRSRVAFPDWLADQVCRRDEIGHMARLAVATGAIDRSNPDLVNQAIIEWAQAG